MIIRHSCAALGQTLDTFEQEIGSIVGTETEGFAGAVGKSEAAITAAAAKSTGNVREQLGIATSFAWKFGAEFVKRGKNVELEAFAASLQRDRPQLSVALQKAKANDGELTAGLTQDASSDRAQSRSLIAQQKDMRTTTPEVDHVRTANPEAGAKVRGSEQTDTTAGSRGQAAAAAGDMGSNPVAEISPREARQQLGKPDASDAEALAEIQGMRLKWNEGIKRFILDESHPWVASMRAANLPAGAGPSGTTKGVMEARQLLNVSSAEAFPESACSRRNAPSVRCQCVLGTGTSRAAGKCRLGHTRIARGFRLARRQSVDRMQCALLRKLRRAGAR